ncbi:MAG: vitamin B12 dependent-methionine synthase activation domain-containing protein [Syntrophales bacterium]|nr:vitamin B12 dependent-methionine synthase activation domain-containing protein [Syntrophales bacterium]
MNQSTSVIESNFPSLPLTGKGRGEWKRLVSGRHGRRLRRLLHIKGDESDRLFHHLIRPRLSFTTKKIEAAGSGSVTLEGGVVLESDKLSKVLEGCRRAVCFVATIGHKIDRKIELLALSHRCSDEYLVDRIGSLAIEEYVHAFHLEMAQRFRGRHQDATMRFSPGYCDWPLEEQEKIFSMVDSARIGVSLLPSLLMKPRKSVSGIFGIVEAEGGRLPDIYNPCTQCEECACHERRSTLSHHGDKDHRFRFYRFGSNGGDDS